MKIRGSILWFVVIAAVVVALTLWHGKKQLFEKSPSISSAINVAPAAATTSNAQATVSVHNATPPAQVAASSVAVGQPQSLQPQDKVTLLKETLQANDADIVFYGRLEDQFSSIVSGAEVGFNIQYENPQARGNQPGRVMSDANGGFTISGYKGANLTIVPKKAGYVLAATGTTFRYSQISPGYFVPDAGNPTVIKMWKLQGVEPLAAINKAYKLRYTGAPMNFDLLAGQIVPSGGDIKVTVNRPAGVISGRNPQDWSVQVEAVNGGLMETSEEESRMTYIAPESGYEPVKNFAMSDANNTWSQAVRQMFFVQSRNGQVYGKVLFSLHINSNPDDFISVTFSGVANTNSSRNWEATAPQ